MRSVLFLVFSTLAIAGEYTTYIGDAYPRNVAAIATDAAGSTYVAGNRAVAGGPATVVLVLGGAGEIQFLTLLLSNVPSPPNDVFVSKIDPSGKVLFTDTFAGKGFDQGLAVAVDPSGNIYVGGTTTSSDFPLSNALQQQPSSYGTGFIVKLSPDGRTILYSTYFGGLLGTTSINALTTDASGNLYLTGSTSATDFPVTSGMPAAARGTPSIPSLNARSTVAFVTAISAAGDKILLSGTVGDLSSISCLAENPIGCPGMTSGVAIALDAARNVYFGGNTIGGVAATAGAFVSQGLGAFVGKIAASGPALVYLTYLGSAAELGPGYKVGATQLSSLAVDGAGNAYLAGITGDPKFPVTPGAYQTTFAGNPINQFGMPSNTDGFLAKLKPDGTAFVWATYLGGSGNDTVNSVAVDSAGNVWGSGSTASPTFPNAQGWSQGGDFLVEFNPTGSALVYSARYPNGTVAQAIALDTTLLIHTAGVTGIVSEISSTGPPTRKIFGISNGAGGSLAGHVSPAEVISIFGPGIGPSTTPSVPPLNGVYPTAFGGVQVTIGGILAPLLYVSDTQINAVVPMGVTTQAASTVQITYGTTIATYPIWIDTSDPSIFPGILNQDGSLNSQTNPAKANSVVSFYATGWQSDFSPLTDGQVASKANNACFNCSSSQGRIVYAGAAPGIVAGVSQFNLQLNGGPQPVMVTALQQFAILIGGLNRFIFVWVTP